MPETFTIPGYTIEGQLGQGGMASVYLAIQESFGRKVALKVMSSAFNADPSFAERFMREARIVAGLSHSSIVPVFDVGEHGSMHYLSMEYLPSGDLKSRIESGERSLELATDVCMSVCAALDVAHRKGFVHRDIKPENILFREDGTPVLTDFGIARAVDGEHALTQAGMLIGTPNYMSPEQVKGEDLDGRSDLYSIGVVFYEVLTGSVPFRADSSLSVALKHISDPVPPLPPEFADYQGFMDQLTAKDRNARFSTGADVIRAVRDLSNRRGIGDPTLARTRIPPQAIPGQRAKPSGAKASRGRSKPKSGTPRSAPKKAKASPPPPPPAAPPLSSPPRRRRSGLRVIAGGLLALAAAGAGAMYLLREHGNPVAVIATQLMQEAEKLPLLGRYIQGVAGRQSASLPVASPASASRQGRSRHSTRSSQSSPSVAATPHEADRPPPADTTPAAADTAAASTSSSAVSEMPAAPAGMDVAPEAAAAAPSVVSIAPPAGVKTPAVRKATTSPAARAGTDTAKDAAAARRLEDERRGRKEKELREVQQRAAQLNAQTKASQIKELLSSARQSYVIGALWQPAGASAADRYRTVLSMQHGQPEALAGARHLAAVLADEVRRSEAAGDIYTATLLITQVRSLQPGHPRLQGLQTRLQQMQTQPADLDAHTKEQLLQAASFISRSHEALAHNPTDPKAADDATDAYDSALLAAPEAPGLPTLKMQLIAVYPGAVQAALSARDVKEAQKLVAAARRHGFSSPELDRLAARVPRPARPADTKAHRAS